MAKAQIVKYSYEVGDSDPCRGNRTWNEKELVLVIQGERPIYVLSSGYPTGWTVCRATGGKFGLFPFPGHREAHILRGSPEVVREMEFPDEDLTEIHRYLDSLSSFDKARERALDLLKGYRPQPASHAEPF